MKSILVVNAGSSSVKCAIFQDEEEVWRAEGKDFSVFDQLPPAQIDIIGHRVVHGGQKFRQTTYLTTKVEEGIAELNLLAPLHNPICLKGIQEMKRRLPKAQHYAVFDTAFHQTIPREAYIYPGPEEWERWGIRKYGFHGISYSYIATQVTEEKCVICHLGSGASMCALLNGQSIDTTMGFSPLDGLMMGTRCGSIDPSIPIYLMLNHKLFPSKVEEIFNFESGLLAVSGISAQMEEVEKAAASGNERARFALELFAYRFKMELAQMVAALEGLDALVFTAGIGEHSPQMRAMLCPHFLKIDPEKNARNERVISTADSTKIYVIPTREEWQIAQECLRQTS